MTRTAVVLMIVYAVLLLDGGATAFASSPPGASAATALIVPAACALLMLVCAGLSSMLGRSKAAGMIGIHLGLVLPLVFAVAIGARALSTTAATTEYRERHAESAEVVAAEPPAVEAPEADASADHDKGYLAYALWRLSAISAGAFVALLLCRPKPADRGGPAPATD